VFRAAFEERLDIGSLDLLQELAARVGMDRARFRTDIERGAMADQLAERRVISFSLSAVTGSLSSAICRFSEPGDSVPMSFCLVFRKFETVEAAAVVAMASLPRNRLLNPGMLRTCVNVPRPETAKTL
jgi:hypothetical protein